MSLKLIQSKKPPLQVIKTRRSKTREIDNFPKGLTHGFRLKMAIFPSLLFEQYRRGKCLLRYSRQLSKGINPWFWSKNNHFSNCFFQAVLDRKISLRIFQNEKPPFSAIKTRSSKSRKIHIFPKGLTHGFRPKMAIFPTLVFRQYWRGKFVLRYSRQFSKGVNPWFWSKNCHFSKCFFQAIQARKMSFTIFQNEKTPFQAKKTRTSKS